MQTIALINQKGGVGKTTTVANLAAALASRGLRIAAIDMDPQSHLTMHFGIEPGASSPGVYEMLTAEAELADTAIAVAENLWIAPACIDLAGAEIELVSTVGREQLLADRIAVQPDAYDFILIDCPPSLSLLTLNALTAADEVIIPLQPHFLALQGFGKLLETISLVRRRVNPRLRVGGVVLCMYESNTRLAGEVTGDVADFLNDRGDPNTPWADATLYESRIRRNIKLAECPSFGESIFNYAPGCPGATDYEALAAEFITLHNCGGEPQDATKPEAETPPHLSTPSQTAEQDAPTEPTIADRPCEPAAPSSPQPAEPVIDEPTTATAPEPVAESETPSEPTTTEGENPWS